MFAQSAVAFNLFVERTVIGKCVTGIQFQPGGFAPFVGVTLRDTTVAGCTTGLDFSHQASLSSSTVQRCIVFGNTLDLSNPSGSSITVTESDVGGGFPPVLPPSLSVDPLFVDPAGGDFHLQPGSPVIDATSATPLQMTDLDLDPLLLDGDQNGTALRDMGYDEYNPVQLSLTGNPVPGGLATLSVTAPAGYAEFLLFSFSQDQIDFGSLGTILIGAPQFPIPEGTYGLPNDPLLSGLELFFQGLGVAVAGTPGSVSKLVSVTL